MNSSEKKPPGVERLFPFVLRSRSFLAGGATLARSKRKLHSILIATDISPGSRDQILRDFADYPVLQHYSSAELEKFFGVRNAKVIGLKKSGLARTIYAELKAFRLNRPAQKPQAEDAQNPDSAAPSQPDSAPEDPPAREA